MPVPPFGFDNSYARKLPGFYVAWKPDPVPAPRLLYLNVPLAEELGLDAVALAGPDGAALFAGNVVPEGAEPIAQVYAGHQFGGFSPQLGDGRALLLGEIIDRHGCRRDLAFKGSGRTPFSRGGDGKAAVGPMLREVLIGEAMHALGIPTTRALAVAATGEQVFREQVLPGAVLTRVAASHLRVGTFQFFAARGEHDEVRRLAEYAIARHDPALAGEPDRFLGLLDAVMRRQASLVAQWMNVGFIHGVMNTDNMALSGETIDYGPCAFLETYDPDAVFSSIDHDGRYAFGRQPQIARWNLARFAECLVPLIADDPERAVAQANEVLGRFPALCRARLLQGQRARLGLRIAQPGGQSIDVEGAVDVGADADDAALADDWLALLHRERVDFTLGWRRLADAAEGRDDALRALFDDPQAPEAWLVRWRARCARDDAPDAGSYADTGAGISADTRTAQARARAAAMRRASPRIIPRHPHVEAALDAASAHDDLVPFTRLLDALRRPFDDDPS
ncbi:MAG: YdiU family protein, partial [Burkholderiaceae bacterium]|nr:YdiU family protein [Burkholderiaceae bacterium]